MNRPVRFVISFVTVQCLLLTPLLGEMAVQAATTAPTPTCNPQQEVNSWETNSYTPYVPAADTTSDETADDGTSYAAENSDVQPIANQTLTPVSLDIAKLNPLYDPASFDQAMQSYSKLDNGYFDQKSNTWFFCSPTNLSTGLGLPGVDYATSQYLNTLTYPLNLITFDNPLDKYALTGEPCTLFKADNTCDETMTSTPVLNPDGTPTLDANGQPETKQTPKYYTEIWNNGHWDAPKADARILETLVYLVTPVTQGGAGEESIEVGKILQTDKSDSDFSSTGSSGVSSHYYDQNDPENPSIIATGVDITGIGSLRITTKVQEDKRIGSPSITYSYSSIPIKVSYQTNQGVAAAAPAPSTDLYSGALGLFSGQLGSLLGSMGLNSNINLNKANLSNFGDVASLIGQSLVSNMLNSPTGSLDGWSLDSVLNNLGRAYIAEQLGLPANSLAYGDTSDDVIRDIGQLTTEKALNLPSGSLSGATSDAIWGNVGRRFLEDSLGVSPNTFATGNTYSQTDFLQRIGAGYIEQKLGLNPQSLQTTDWGTFTSSEKAKIYFGQGDASYVDMQLNMGSNQTGTASDNYGFSSADFADPAGKVINNHSSANVARFLQIVGDRALQLSLGKFISAVAGTSNVASPVNTTAGTDFLQPLATAFGLDIKSTNRGIFGGNTVYTAVTPNGTATQMEALGFVTVAQVTQLAQSILHAEQTNQFNLDKLPTVGLLITLHNTIQPFISMTQAANTLVGSAVSEADLGTFTAVNQPTLLTIQGNLSAAAGTLQKYDDAITTSLNASGQSGVSAALGLPGTLYNVNPTTGNYTSVALSTDPVTAFLHGNVSNDLMQSIGRVVIGNRLASNATAQQTIAGMLTVNTNTTYGTISSISTDVSALGQATTSGNEMLSLIDPTLWSKGGLQLSDFERIFMKNLAIETFDRIGQEQLLSAAWGLYAVPAIGNSASSTVGQITKQINQVSQDINFYATRIKDIQNIGQNLTIEIGGATNVPQSIKDELQQLNLTNIPQTLQDIQKVSAQYEAAIGNLPLDTFEQKIQQQINKAVHDMQEIAAGHSLSFNQTPTTASAARGCLLPSTIQGFFVAGLKGFSNVASQIAACQIDTKLGLPTGSIYAWYKSKDYSLDSLELVTGKLFAKQNNLTLTDDEAKAKGAEILEASAVNALVGQVPELSTAEKDLGIGPKDIVALFTGNTGKVLATLGGKMMDHYFNWSPGTAAAIINPQCYDTVSKTYSTCTGDMATQVRENAVASAGLKELGITLNFPATFNIFDSLGSGDFISDFGNSSISETLGLAPNSFTGSFSDVRAANDPHQILTAFSWYDNAAFSEISKLTKDIGVDPNYNNLISSSNDLKNARTQMSNYILNQMGQAASPIWAATPTNLTNPGLIALANNILGEQNGVIAAMLRSVSADLTGDTQVPLALQDIANFNNSLDSLTGPGEVSRMTNQMLAFINRTTNLDKQFNDVPGKFKDFITGENDVAADDLAKNQGAVALGNILDQKFLAPLLKNTPFEPLISVFNALSTATGCGSGLNIGAFILGSSSAADSVDCLSGGLQGFSMKTLFSSGYTDNGMTGVTTNGAPTSNVTAVTICDDGEYFDVDPLDPNYDDCVQGTTVTPATPSNNALAQKKAIAIRNTLLNSFASSSWGMSMEKGLDLEPGTLKAIALKPQDAPEIAIDQGLRLIGSQLLGVKPSDLGKDDSIKGMYLALSQSIIAGFCPVNPLTNSGSSVASGDLQLIVSTQQSCSMDFNAPRAVANLQSNFITFIQTGYNNKTLPKEFGLADIGLAIVGGTQGIYLDALARVAAQTNAQLGTSPRAAAFYINFNDIRAATGFATLGDGALDNAGRAQAASWIRSNVVNIDTNTCIVDGLYYPIDPTSNTCANPDTLSPVYGMTDQQVVDWYASSAADNYTTDDGITRVFNVVGQFNLGRQNLVNNTQHTAQQRLEYELSDAAIFALDPNVPVGFTHAMMAGTSYQRAQMLGLYALNIIYSDSTFLKNIGFTPQQVDDIGIFASNCLTGHTCNNLPTSAFGVIDTWINKQTGLGLPTGVTAGLVAWSTTGFAQSKFNATTIKVGGSAIPSAGIILENWGLQKLFAWGDKALGLQAGSVYQMYSAGVKVVQAIKAAQAADQFANFADSLDDGSAQAGAYADKADSAANKADANVSVAEAAAVAVVINIVFKSQISDEEKNLGLVPGTGAIAVGILTSIAFGAAVPWAEIALFIALNLFGVYKVEVFQQATGDGYYPFTGRYGQTQLKPNEYPDPHPPVGTFDAKNKTTYQSGLEAAAQAKVYYVLQDLLIMPAKWGPTIGVDPNSLWIPQIYTARQQDVVNLDYLISRPAPWQMPGSYGYGSLATRATLTYNRDGSVTTTPTKQLSGVFYDPTCSGNNVTNTTTSTATATTPTPGTTPTPTPTSTPAPAAGSTPTKSCVFGDHILLQW